MKVKVSVIIAAYNIEDYILKCLESVKAQTLKDFEAIVVDDGSTDRTGKICDEFCARDKRFRVVHKKNGGLSEARNFGIKEAKGEYVALVDGDDYADERFIEKLYEKVLAGAEVAICGFTTVPEGKVEKFLTETVSGVEATKKLLTGQENYMIVSWNKLYKRELFEGIEFPVGRKHEDSLTTYKVLAKAATVAIFDEPLYFYVQREGSIMDSVKLGDRLDMKMLAAREAKEYFGDGIGSVGDAYGADGGLYAAAEVAEVLAVFSFLDNIIAGKLKRDSGQYFDWLKEIRGRLVKNPMMSRKLKCYVFMATRFGGGLYRGFRKVVR